MWEQLSTFWRQTLFLLVLFTLAASLNLDTTGLNYEVPSVDKFDGEIRKTDGSSDTSFGKILTKRHTKIDHIGSGGRSKRQRVDKGAKFEKLKKLKGSKHKYEVQEVENVYEEVDEETYAEKVLERQDDDWIVDDDGCGYVEDGREIFDDDLDDESISRNKKQKSESRKRGRPKVEKAEVTRPVGGNIRNMFANMPAKKRKETGVKLDDDDILGDLIQEIDSTPRSNQRSGPSVTPLNFKQEVSSRDYLRSFSTLAPKPKPVRASVIPTPTHIPVQTRPKHNDVNENGNSELPDIEDNFTEELSVADEMDTNTSELEIKKEPQEIDPKIEDFDSMDGFSDLAFQQVDKVIEEFESQATEPLIKVKEEAPETSENNSRDLEKKLASGALWDDLEIAATNSESVASVNVDLSQLPLTTNEKGEKVFRFFYWDAYEDVFKQPGVVYLFGKVFVPSADTYVSCCVIMKEIERTIFLLPREEFIDLKTGKSTGKPVTLQDVYDEFNQKISVKYKIDPFRSRPIEKKYAFELDDVPKSCEYVEVKYSPSMSQLPKNLTGETIAHVFGTNASFLELLLLQRKIKGPGWLELVDPMPATNPVSFCKVEVLGGHIRNVNVCQNNAPPPPLVLASVSLRTAMHPKSHQTEIIMACVVLHNQYYVDKPVNSKLLFQDHFCAMTRPSDTVFPLDVREKLKNEWKLKVERCDSERALLCFLLAKLGKSDPDLVVGHGLLSGDLDILVHRLAHLKIPNWSRIGRLKRANIPPPGKGRFQVERYPMCGRLVCDIKLSAKELIRARSYDLGTLCQSVLHIKEERLDLTLDEVKAKYSSGSSLVELIRATMMDSVYSLRLMYEMNVIPLALQITNIAGNVMSRTLMGGRAERNEFLLLHAFTEKGFIVPDKQYGKKPNRDDDIEEVMEEMGQKKGRRKKPQYAGGLVLDPKVGFYDKLILLMDFNSLYPSIIHEYNICFTTVKKIITTSEDGEEVTAEPPNADEELGVLPTEIRKLVESRRDVKRMMKTPNLSADLRMQYDIRQMALKLTANSMYGCLGFSNSRFYAKPLAALVSAKGREILMSTKDLVQKLSYEVVYGDTDSIMINTNILEYDQVLKIGNKIKVEVNKMYRHVELDIDGVFKYMLLLKKKKYAAVSLTRLPNGELVETQEIKGLDMVRRDWSQLAAEAGKFVLSQILTDQEPDERIQNIHRKMSQLRSDLLEGRVPLSLMAITKQLTKSPGDYSDKKSQPHVQVALRMNTRGARLKGGDTVHYVICEDGTNNPATQRAYHVDELKNSESLKLDIKYYLSQQIHPVVSRLIEPIEGTDSAQIAESLGLDPTQFKEKPKPSEDFEAGDNVLLKEAERFKNCEKFIFTCVNPDCCCDIAVDSPMRRKESGGNEFILEKCANTDCKVQPLQYLVHIKNCLTNVMRSYITKYYQGWMICEDPACPQRSRRVPIYFDNGYPVCTRCGKNNMYREYSEKDLYTQLCYLQHVFDITKPPHSSFRCSIDTFNAYCALKEHVARTLSCSGYSVVSLTKLFRGLFPEAIKIKKEPVDDS